MPDTILPVFFVVNGYSRQVGSAAETIGAIAEHALALHGLGTGDTEARAVALTAMKIFAGQAIAYRQHRQASAINNKLLAGARTDAPHDPGIHGKAEAEANSALFWDLCSAGETIEKAEAEFHRRMDEDRIAIARQDAALAAANDDDEAAERAA